MLWPWCESLRPSYRIVTLLVLIAITKVLAMIYCQLMMLGYRLRYKEPQTYLQSYMHTDTFAGSQVHQLMYTIIDGCSSAQVTHQGRSEGRECAHCNFVFINCLSCSILLAIPFCPTRGSLKASTSLLHVGTPAFCT